jgi:hypothetical protein
MSRKFRYNENYEHNAHDEERPPHRHSAHRPPEESRQRSRDLEDYYRDDAFDQSQDDR